MTIEEVETAENTKNGGRIICVEQHKTQRYFGQAAIPLKANEYAWFERYNKLRQYVDGGSEASTFFHNSRGGVLLKLDNYFKQAREGLRLGIAPTFNMLRSSVATYAKRQLGHETYRKVATFMCHDEHTAKRFYHADDPAEVKSSNQLVSATDDEGFDEWKPTQDSSEDDSGVDEEPVGEMIRKEAENSPVQQKEVRFYKLK
ncbi:uncharacterized protein LOC117263654, partial [Tachysurus ichikawai]